MTTVAVEQITFTFDAAVVPLQYEAGGICVSGWPQGSKVVDVVSNDTATPPAVTWLIEVKDFRVITSPPRSSNLGGLAATMEAKVRDTVAALPVVAAASQDPATRSHAASAASAAKYRVILHLEPHLSTGQHAELFPVMYAAIVLLKLQQLIKDIDPNPLVLDIGRTPRAGVPWSAA